MTATPFELMETIERDARQLDTAGRELAKAIKRLSELEFAYEKALQDAKITMFHEAKTKGERMPAEDIRHALAHRQVPKDVYAAYLTGKATVDALRAWARSTEHSLSARQSLLNALKAELVAS